MTRRYAHEKTKPNLIAVAFFFGGFAVMRANYLLQTWIESRIKREVVTRWANETHQGD